MEKNQTTIQTTESDSGLKKKIIFILKFVLIALAYGLNNTLFTGIPFLFLGNRLDCINEQGQPYQCQLEEACSNKYGYLEQEQTEYPSVHSLTMYLDIYCDRQIIQAWLLFIGTFGKIFGNLVLILFHIQPEKKEDFLNVVFITMGVVLCLLVWIQHIVMFFFTFFIWYFGFTLLFGTIFTHASEAFPEYISKYSSAILNVFWPSMMIVYFSYTYFYGSWQNTMIHITGIPILIIGIARLLLSTIDLSNLDKNQQLEPAQLQIQDDSNSQTDIEKVNQSEQNLVKRDNIQNNEKDNSKVIEESQNYKSDLNSVEIYIKKDQSLSEKYLPFLYHGDALKRNFCIWTLGWACNFTCYMGCYLQMNELHGDLFANNFIFTLIETVSSFCSIGVVVKFEDKLKQITILIYLISGIAFISSVFVNSPHDISNRLTNQPDTLQELVVHYLVLFFQILPIIIAKVSYETSWTILLTYQQKLIPLKYQQSQFACSSLLGGVAINSVPFYKYFCDKIGVSPFLGYSIFCFITAYYSTKFENINMEEEEKVEDQKSLKCEEKQT